MYKTGHALKGRGSDIYRDFTDRSALKEVNAYIVGVIPATAAVYFVFYGRYFTNNKILFWLYAEFLIILVIREVVVWGEFLLSCVVPAIRKQKRKFDFSAAANAVIRMFLVSIFACVLTFTMTGLPVKAPVVQAGESEIIVGHTTAKELLANGFAFAGKTPNDFIENKRNSHFSYGETAELVKEGEGYGYVNLTPRYKDRARLEDCIITYYGISSKSKRFDCVKIGDKSISNLSVDRVGRENMRAFFSLSPVSYQESKGKESFSLRMQTYPYMLWKRYTIEVAFLSDGRANHVEVYAQHTLWE